MTLAEYLDADAAWILADLPKTDSVTIQQPAVSVDANGEQVLSWSTLATVDANVEAQAVEEEYEAARLKVSREYSIVCAYVAGVTEKCRILYQGKYLNIARILADETTKRTLRIEAFADRDTYDNAFITTTTTTTA
jgi:SPP1 family predicted phage head-tail adaptor